MPIYNVYVTCDQCGQPHPVNVKLDLPEDSLNNTPLAEYFAGKPLPSAITFMQSNNYRCPHTKQLFPAANINDAILFAA